MFYKSELLSAIVLTLLIITSCRSRISNQELTLTAITQELEENIKVSKSLTQQNFHQLLAKTYDPSTAERAKRWYLIADSIKAYSTTLDSQIILLKENIRSKNTPFSTDSIRKNLQAYGRAYEQLDSSAFSRFTTICKSLQTVADSIDQIKANISKEQALAILTKLQSQVSLSETYFIEYCNSRVPNYDDSYYNETPLINQNVKKLKAKEELEINVGLGFLSYPSYPKILVNGTPIASSENGFFQYKMKAPEAKGVYRIPIVIDYILYNKRIVVKKEVSYEVE
ncbi:MAG: hypothetical protein K2P88_17220 [Chitinophagaceae bacterium]|uniref:hypothetical protein n=1 Tax=unclassified Paraflavitalea TaxID=2798305 RepID=UPI003D3379D8|nr:hypothetical protein [Chitinophagaceae bacterium]